MMMMEDDDSQPKQDDDGSQGGKDNLARAAGPPLRAAPRDKEELSWSEFGVLTGILVFSLSGQQPTKKETKKGRRLLRMTRSKPMVIATIPDG